MTARQAAFLRLRQNFFRSPRLFHPLTGGRLRADSSDMVIPAEDFPRIFRTPARALLCQLEPRRGGGADSGMSFNVRPVSFDRSPLACHGGALPPGQPVPSDGLRPDYPTEVSCNRMFEMTQTPQALTFRLSSDRRMLGRLLPLSETYLRARGARQTPRFLIVLRELVLNGITHGNRSDPERTLVCRIIRDRRRDRFVISVQDEGAGFDYRSLDMALPENPAGLHRRGYILVNRIADSIRFNRAGNRVTVFLSNRPARLELAAGSAITRPPPDALETARWPKASGSGPRRPGPPPARRRRC